LEAEVAEDGSQAHAHATASTSEQLVNAAAAMSDAEIMQQHTQHSDCGIVGQRQRFKSQLASITAAMPQDWESSAESVMQVGDKWATARA
jgi:hypothetical protein